MNARCTPTLAALAVTMLLSFNTGAQLQTGDSLLPRMPLPWPEASLNQWRFDDPAWLTNARTQPLLMNGPSFRAGRDTPCAWPVNGHRYWHYPK